MLHFRKNHKKAVVVEQEQQKKSAWKGFKEGLKAAPKGKKWRFTVDFINTHEDL